MSLALLGAESEPTPPTEEQQQRYGSAFARGALVGGLVFGVSFAALGSHLWPAHRVIGGVLGFIGGQSLGSFAGGLLTSSREIAKDKHRGLGPTEQKGIR